jgi:hypothetical protein
MRGADVACAAGGKHSGGGRSFGSSSRGPASNEARNPRSMLPRGREMAGIAARNRCKRCLGQVRTSGVHIRTRRR